VSVIAQTSSDLGADLARIARERRCDAIVIGWHNPSAPSPTEALARKLLASVSADVVVYCDGGTGTGQPDGPVVVADLPGTVDVPFVTVGGGMGSFSIVTLLRQCGVPTHAIRVLTSIDRPYETYRYLTTNSQIPARERLRSDSASEMDNIWGWPSYAFREAFD